LEKNVKVALTLSAVCIAVSGCANSIVEDQDRNVASSLPYDRVQCEALLTQRNQLAQRYNLPVNAKPVFTDQPMGLGPFIPDVRSSRRRDVERASGEIDAMNRSLTRRKCVDSSQG
jgi:hypothetical protein